MNSLVIFIFGLLIGSFLNVVISRLKTGQSLLGRRSACPFCQKTIAWYDNIPLLSFAALKARCRHCQKKISWQYPLVELATAGAFVWLYQAFGLSLDFLVTAVFSGFLIVIFVYDFLYSLILDVVTLPAMGVALLLNIYQGFGWQDLLIGVLAGGGFFLIQFVISQGRWIGGGDIRLGALMGLMLGWQMLLVAGFIAYLSGAVAGLLLLILGYKKMSSPIPFGTFLTAATFITFIYGRGLLEWYLNLIGLI